MFDTKLKENPIKDVTASDDPPESKTEGQDDKFAWLGGRSVPLPPGMTLDKLKNMTAADIDKAIKESGAGIGYAAIIAMAAGKGGTPSGTQLQAARFLVERGAELVADDAADHDISSRLRALPREQLMKLLHVYEEEALKAAVTGQKVIDVLPVAEEQVKPVH